MLARAEDPALAELHAAMVVTIAQLLADYREAYPQYSRAEVLGEIVYQATFLRNRSDETPDFDYSSLDRACDYLYSIFGKRGMTRTLALGQIICDANLQTLNE